MSDGTIPRDNALDNLIGNREQTFQQFSDMFSSISIEGSPATSGFDEVLTYLQDEENSLVRESAPSSILSDSAQDGFVSEPTQNSDPGLATVLNRWGPCANPRQSSTMTHIDSLTNSRIQCLDVMLEHLQSRELSLERSPEYSIELNISQLLEAGVGEISEPRIWDCPDNRLLPDSSENCSSSDIPDNDRRGSFNCRDALCRGSRLGAGSQEDIEVIEMPSESTSRFEQGQVYGMESDQSRVNLKVDNFVSYQQSGYDSDKDIDETEEGGVSGGEDEPYIPSFHNVDNNDLSRDSSQEVPSLSDSTLDLPSSPVDCNRAEVALPGEVLRNNDLEESAQEPLVRCRELDSNQRTEDRSNSLSDNSGNPSEQTLNTNDIGESSRMDLVESFSLDASFDYDNVSVLSNRLSHYRCNES